MVHYSRWGIAVPYTIRESLNNAIAHQDYSKGARINVVEFEDDHLVFLIMDLFLPKSVEDVVLNDTPEEVYRPFGWSNEKFGYDWNSRWRYSKNI
jgi:hypothetical protein